MPSASPRMALGTKYRHAAAPCTFESNAGLQLAVLFAQLHCEANVLILQHIIQPVKFHMDLAPYLLRHNLVERFDPCTMQRAQSAPHERISTSTQRAQSAPHERISTPLRRIA
jgi:hypothetical protein